MAARKVTKPAPKRKSPAARSRSSGTSSRHVEKKTAGTKKPQSGKRFVPTDAHRDRARTLSGYGLPHDQIRLRILGPEGRPISRDTLTKYFAEELETGKAIAHAAILQTSFNMAMGVQEVREVDANGNPTRTIRKAVPPNRTMQIWYQKTQMGVMEEEARVRTRIAEKLAELKGLLGTDADPNAIAKEIKVFLDELEGATRAPKPNDPK